MHKKNDIFKEETLKCICGNNFQLRITKEIKECPKCKATEGLKVLGGFLRGRYPSLKVDEFSRSPTYNLCSLEKYNKATNPEEFGAELYTKVEREKTRLRLRGKRPVKKKTEADKHTLAEAIDKFEAEILPFKSVSEQTNVECQLKFWKSKLGGRKLSSFSAKGDILEVMEIWDSLKEGKRKRGNATLNRYLAALSTVFTASIANFLWMDGDNPCSKIPNKPEAKPRLRYLSKEEIKKLLATCETHHVRDAILLSLHTGGRKQEVWKLKFSDINWKKNHMTFLNTKSGKPRSIPMNRTIREVLNRRRQEIELQSKFVFPVSKGNIKDGTKHFIDKATSFEKSWRNAKEAAGLNKPHPDGKTVWHTLRHTYASWSVMSGMDMESLKKLMGHENISQTDKYAHLAVDHLQSAMDKLDAELNSNATEMQMPQLGIRTN